MIDPNGPSFVEIAIAERYARRARRARAVAAGQLTGRAAARDAIVWVCIAHWAEWLYIFAGKWPTDVAVPLADCVTAARRAADDAAARAARAAPDADPAQRFADRSAADLAALARALEHLLAEIAAHPAGAVTPVAARCPIPADAGTPGGAPLEIAGQ